MSGEVRCELCWASGLGTRLGSVAEAEAHAEAAHAELPSAWPCAVCSRPASFPSFEQLRAHRLARHPDPPPAHSPQLSTSFHAQDQQPSTSSAPTEDPEPEVLPDVPKKSRKRKPWRRRKVMQEKELPPPLRESELDVNARLAHYCEPLRGAGESDELRCGLDGSVVRSPDLQAHLIGHLGQGDESLKCGRCVHHSARPADLAQHFLHKHFTLSTILRNDLVFRLGPELLELAEACIAPAPALTPLLFDRLAQGRADAMSKALRSGLKHLACATCPKAPRWTAVSPGLLKAHIRLRHFSQIKAFRCSACDQDVASLLHNHANSNMAETPVALQDQRDARIGNAKLCEELERAFPPPTDVTEDEEELGEQRVIGVEKELERPPVLRAEAKRSELVAFSHNGRVPVLLREATEALLAAHSALGEDGEGTEATLSCGLCLASLPAGSSARDVEAHLYSHYPVPLFFCQPCLLAFQFQAMEAHLAKRHGGQTPLWNCVATHSHLQQLLDLLHTAFPKPSPKSKHRMERERCRAVVQGVLGEVAAGRRAEFLAAEAAVVGSETAAQDCRLCSARQLRPSILERHVDGHLDEKLFHCPRCNTTARRMVAHMRQAHSDSSRVLDFYLRELNRISKLCFPNLRPTPAPAPAPPKPSNVLSVKCDLRRMAPPPKPRAKSPPSQRPMPPPARPPPAPAPLLTPSLISGLPPKPVPQPRAQRKKPPQSDEPDTTTAKSTGKTAEMLKPPPPEPAKVAPKAAQPPPRVIVVRRRGRQQPPPPPTSEAENVEDGEDENLNASTIRIISASQEEPMQPPRALKKPEPKPKPPASSTTANRVTAQKAYPAAKVWAATPTSSVRSELARRLGPGWMVPLDVGSLAPLPKGGLPPRKPWTMPQPCPIPLNPISNRPRVSKDPRPGAAAARKRPPPTSAPQPAKRLRPLLPKPPTQPPRSQDEAEEELVIVLPQVHSEEEALGLANPLASEEEETGPEVEAIAEVPGSGDHLFLDPEDTKVLAGNLPTVNFHPQRPSSLHGDAPILNSTLLPNASTPAAQQAPQAVAQPVAPAAKPVQAVVPISRPPPPTPFSAPPPPKAPKTEPSAPAALKTEPDLPPFTLPPSPTSESASTSKESSGAERTPSRTPRGRRAKKRGHANGSVEERESSGDDGAESASAVSASVASPTQPTVRSPKKEAAEGPGGVPVTVIGVLPKLFLGRLRELVQRSRELERVECGACGEELAVAGAGGAEAVESHLGAVHAAKPLGRCRNCQAFLREHFRRHRCPQPQEGVRIKDFRGANEGALVEWLEEVFREAKAQPAFHNGDLLPDLVTL